MGFWKEAAKWGTAALTGGASLIFDGTAESLWNDYTGNTAIGEANKINIEEAQKNRDWQEKMFDKQVDLSNTAYQRAMDDAEKAGLNPALMASTNGGASTPSAGGGAQTTVQPKNSGVQTALQTAGAIAGITGSIDNIAKATKTMTENKYLPESTKSQISNTNANTALTNAKTQETKANTDNLKLNASLLSKQEKLYTIDIAERYQNAKTETEKKKIEEEWYKSKTGQFMTKAGLFLSDIAPIAGATIGAMIGGPIGAGIGYGIGHGFRKPNKIGFQP